VSALVLKGGRVVDPSHDVDGPADVRIESGRIAALGRRVDAKAATVLDVSGRVVCPGFIDLHTHLREPGGEEKETIATGTSSASPAS
jgi:dihydroorotase